jgi:hypothetical protein
MLEFAIVGPIFFLCLFAALSSMVYEFERSLVVTAVTTGARTAASASVGAPNSSVAQANLDQAAKQARDLMAHSLIGTNVIDLNDPACIITGLSCPTAVGLLPCLTSASPKLPAWFPQSQGIVYVYATNKCGNNEIQVVATGSPANLVGAFKIRIPLTIQATVVAVEYQP